MDYNANNQNPNGYELGWDDSISHQDTEFVLLSDGDYEFEIVNFERGSHNGSAKLPPCKKAVVTFRIKNPAGEPVSIKENFYLHSTQMNKLCNFFRCIGQGEDANGQIRMNWNAVIGSTGRVTIGTKLYNDKKYNEIKKFLPKQAGSAPAVPGYTTPATYAPQPTYQPAQAPAAYAPPQPTYPQVNTATPWDQGQQGQQAPYQGYTAGKF
jgi:hypothetical protein